MQLAMEILVSLFLIIGAFFMLVGGIGMVRLPDLFMRLHAPTKSSTLGLGSFLISAIIYAAFHGRFGFAELLLTLLAVVSYVTEDMKATVVIASMVLLSTLLRFVQEGRSNRAAARLKIGRAHV